MSPKPDQQRIARDLYLHTDKSQSEIAEILNVNRKTIFLWIKKGRWEEMKIAAQQGPGTILQHLYDHVHEINKKIRSREDKCPFPAEVEMLRKLLGMTKNIAKKNTGFYMEAFEELSHFIAKKNWHLSHQVIKHMDEYVEGTFGDEGFHMDKRVEENVAEVERNLARKNGDVRTNVRHSNIKKVAFPFPHIHDHELVARVSNDLESKFASAKDNTVYGKNAANAHLPSEKNGARMGHPAASGPTDENSSKSLITSSPDEIIVPATYPISTEEKNIENEACAHIGRNNTLPTPDLTRSFGEGRGEVPLSTYYASLQPSKRPSPFREGNIIWVNHINDVDEDYYEKNMKGADSIRHYPDMDPNLKFTKAIYDLRIKGEKTSTPAPGSAPKTTSKPSKLV